MTRMRIVRYTWKWDEAIKIAMEVPFSAHNDLGGAKHYAETMIRSVVKDEDEWIYHSSCQKVIK